MKHRIAAGVIVEDDNRVLLVRHFKLGVYDFWVAPGGGVEGAEDLRSAARREALEECGLDVEPKQLAYIEELFTAEVRMCKFWFIGHVVSGNLSVSAPEAAHEHIVEADFVSQRDFSKKTIYPPVLREEYWTDRESGFASPRYLGVREMRFE